MVKRTFDVTVALLGLLLLAPVVLVMAALVKLDSPGPAFFRAARVGKGGRLFQMYKTRTMRWDPKQPGPAVTIEGDPRVTRVGRTLRRTKLDEIPQLLNVLKGDMSLVGPRPEDPGYVATYSPDQLRVLSVRPGVTSPASIAFSDEERILFTEGGDAAYATTILPVKLDLDLRYVGRQSFWYDLTILARTVGLFFPRHLVTLRRFNGLLRSFVRRRVPWALIDAPVVVAAFYAAFLFRFLDAPDADVPVALARLNAAIFPLVVVYIAVNYLFGLHRRVWRYASAPEIIPIMASAATSTLVVAAVDVGVTLQSRRFLPLSVVLLGGFLSFCGLGLVRYRWRLLTGLSRRWAGRGATGTRALIYGAGEAGQLLAWRLLSHKEGRYFKVVGFIDDDRSKRGMRIHGIEVLGGRASLARIVDRHAVDLVILAIANVRGEKLRDIVSVAQETPAQIKIAPDILGWMDRPHGTPLVREVRLEDLLGRPRATVDRAACHRVMGEKVVLVTGACGSIGSELCQQIASFAPRRLIALDNNETGLYDLEVELRARFAGLDIVVVVGDVTDDTRMDSVFQATRPQVIFHVAAYKHVPLMEHHPEEAVRVNIQGTWVTLAKAREYHAERFLLVSTDKAVNPSSVMGATKRVAEMLLLSLSDEQVAADGHDRTPALICTAVRFGNVLGSRGSVVPTFAKQIELGGPVTVTHPEMTRYFMDISEAASLIIQAATLTRGRDIFMLDMGERIRIGELARKMIRLRGLRPDIDIPIVYTGIRPGEKLHEELNYAEEEKLETTHPLIHRLSRQTQPDPRVLQGVIERLLRLAASGRREQLVSELLDCARFGAAEQAVVALEGEEQPATRGEQVLSQP